MSPLTIMTACMATVEAIELPPSQIAARIETALARNGYVIAPTNPTDAMMDAGDSCKQQGGSAANIYERMIEEWRQ